MMKLKSLFRSMDVIMKGGRDIEITGLSSDSRTVSPGNLFLAKRGVEFDGTQFITQAISGGAAAILTDIYDPFLELAQIIHPNPSEIEAKLAARYYENPSKDLFVVGVSGTKGKTTTSYLIKHLFDRLGMFSGLVGTVETMIGESRFFYTLKTHDFISKKKWLKEMLQKGCKGAVLEVSSHGLDQGRVEKIEFDLAIFTNLYPDHLDYHQTLQKYAEAKKKLFEKGKKGIFNADSPWSAFMGQGMSFGIDKGDIRAEHLVLSPESTRFVVDGCPFLLPLIGKFNVYNALGAIAAGLEIGAKLEKISEILAGFGSVPARLERIGNVFIDFAHTGDALANVLQTLKELSKGRLILVFGCGGNRDPERRGGMARAAEKWADISIITNDNPRKEDPEEIARQIVSGFQKSPMIELDRKKAIEMALSLARPDDLILIAGKGHEKVQIFSSQTVPFDDAMLVKSYVTNN